MARMKRSDGPIISTTKAPPMRDSPFESKRGLGRRPSYAFPKGFGAGTTRVIRERS